MTLALEAICDLLTPGVTHQIAKRFGPFSGVEGELRVNGGCIDLVVVRGNLAYTKQIIAAKDVADGTYRDKFVDRVSWLLNGATETIGEPAPLRSSA